MLVQRGDQHRAQGIGVQGEEALELVTLGERERRDRLGAVRGVQVLREATEPRPGGSRAAPRTDDVADEHDRALVVSAEPVPRPAGHGASVIGRLVTVND